MEHMLLPVAEFLEELRSKRVQVVELEKQISRLKLLLVERDAEIHGKELQYKLRDDKQFKHDEDIKKTIEDYRKRYKDVLEENIMYQKAISEKHQLYVQSESEKQILELKLEQAERKIKEFCENTHYMNQSLTALSLRQESLSKDYKALDEKYQELMEASSNLESYVLGITAKADEKWKLAYEMQTQCEQLKKELSNTQAHLQLIGKGSSSANVPSLRSENEVLKTRLIKAEEREQKLAQELETERQKRLSIEKEFAEALSQCLRKKQ